MTRYFCFTPRLKRVRITYPSSVQNSRVEPEDATDSGVALERTFLGYLRTSLALSMLGITVAQLL